MPRIALHGAFMQKTHVCVCVRVCVCVCVYIMIWNMTFGNARLLDSARYFGEGVLGI